MHTYNHNLTAAKTIEAYAFVSPFAAVFLLEERDIMLCCEKLRINGVVTHELGCIEAWRDYGRKCKWCGNKFRPEFVHQVLCSESCAFAYRS